MSGFVSPPCAPGQAHKTQTSTGVADKKTIAKGEGATAMMLSAKTNNARVTFEGTDPAVGGPGIIIVAGAQPVLFPFGSDIEFVSEIAGVSELNVLYLA